MKNDLRIDFTKNEIIMSRSFEKCASIAGSEEYRRLQLVRQDYPTFSVVRRSIKKAPTKETYAGLTYEYMRDYIILHSTPEDELAAVAEFDELILVSKCHSKSQRYPVIKKWFLTKYPQADDFGIASIADVA